MDPLDDAATFAIRLDAATNLMYVGHLPFIQQLVSYLITRDPKRLVVMFRNGGVVRLNQ